MVGLTLDSGAVLQQQTLNAESWSVFVVGDCGGREAEQEEKKKKTLNEFACLVNRSSRGVAVRDNKQRRVLFRRFHLCSQATAQTATFWRDNFLQCVLALYLAAHYQLLITQISWGMRLKSIWVLTHYSTLKNPQYTSLHLLLWDTISHCGISVSTSCIISFC